MGCEQTRIIQASDGGASDGVISAGAYDADGNIDISLTAGGPVQIPADGTYLLTFIASDWVVGATESTITIPVATHQKGSNPTITIKEGTTVVGVDTLDISATGDVTLSVPNGLPFDGSVSITR